MKNSSRLADQIPFTHILLYSTIECVAPEFAINFVKRLSDLSEIRVNRRVQDIERFLDLLKSSDYISTLDFTFSQPQELFDRLPEHCAIQQLTIFYAPSDLAFLARLEHLNYLNLGFSIDDVQPALNVLEELQFLSQFNFRVLDKKYKVEFKHSRPG